jgi:hypothetical protein
VRPYLKKPYQKKRAGGMAQGEGPEFKPQYRRRKGRDVKGDFVTCKEVENMTNCGHKPCDLEAAMQPQGPCAPPFPLLQRVVERTPESGKMEESRALPPPLAGAGDNDQKLSNSGASSGSLQVSRQNLELETGL